MPAFPHAEDENATRGIGESRDILEQLPLLIDFVFKNAGVLVFEREALHDLASVQFIQIAFFPVCYRPHQTLLNVGIAL
jgi:hypothetical protein